ncbi:rhodoquinone biosynthesis methyltransferase RquA [Chitinibacter tainanensis]|uniref:rhodoquinone biosynthesis methyltransferase RquA n=1 Tax=Chitinibacter tainanensis TaxID=230667 RepID=UPI00041AB633|nr:rhodoquinone biosynthesis methyltransferase RquA [Chitinibacter tainanensis]
MTKNPPPLQQNPYYEGVPTYMTEVYDWAYVDPNWVRALDRNLVVKTLLFLNDQRLMRRYLAQLQPGQRVWQLAHVYGDLVQRAAEKVGPHGEFVLTDVTPIQIEHGSRKLKDMPWAKVIRSDAADYQPEGRFDVICSFFLLHEVPEQKKREIVEHMLAQLPDDGKLVFVDYHNPARWQPIRYILKLVNHYLEPFANALWQHEISHYAKQPERYHWEKETIFGGVYQCVIVTKKR